MRSSNDQKIDLPTSRKHSQKCDSMFAYLVNLSNFGEKISKDKFSLTKKYGSQYCSGHIADAALLLEKSQYKINRYLVFWISRLFLITTLPLPCLRIIMVGRNTDVTNCPWVLISGGMGNQNSNFEYLESAKKLVVEQG